MDAVNKLVLAQERERRPLTKALEIKPKPYAEPQLDPTQKFAMNDLGYGPAMTDLGIERKSPSDKEINQFE